MKQEIYWDNLYGSGRSYEICEAAKQHDGLIVVLATDIATMMQLKHELRFFATKDLKILELPDWEILPYDNFSPHQDIVSKRLHVLHELLQLKKGVLLVAVTTLMQRLMPRDYVAHQSLVLHKHQELNLINFRNELNNKGYYCVDRVLQHGEYAMRGSIIDLFPSGCKLPYRIDLFDNEIDSIRTFNPETQRSIQELVDIKLLPAREFPLTPKAIDLFQQQWQREFNMPLSAEMKNIITGASVAGIEQYLPLFFEQLHTLFDYLPANSLLIHTTSLITNAENFWHEIKHRYEQLRHDRTRPLLAPQKLYLAPEQLFEQFKIFAQIKIRDSKINKIPDLTLVTGKFPLTKLQNFLATLKERVLFCAESAGRREVLTSLLETLDIRPVNYNNWHDFLTATNQYGITIAQLDHGFWGDVIIIPEALLFGHHIIKQRGQKQQQDPEAIIRDLIELKPEDPVVHIEHGIGRFKGLKTLTAGGQEADYLVLEYAADTKLYVPIASLHLISRYMGANSENAPLNHLGSKQWDKAKRKAAAKIADIAAELLDIYAQRAAKIGYAFTKPDEYQAFASAFAFDTTPDQQDAINHVIQDMISPKSMDRLICGDVGFGKTEVAMRAAFIAAQNSKQAAILVPTTLLAQQHYDTFQDRFAAWPLNIALLSRFRTSKQQQNIIEKLKSGAIDIVIGTHKLLQSGIAFKDLGLLIIDEEHRFGVKQKEKLKSLRANVDILTLTATPIPRTLNMALAEIRDLSIIASPPAKRLSIKTFVNNYNESLIREAIIRETMRGGQVYYLHNDISSIDRIAANIQQLVPTAKIKVAHGQMPERQLEQIMGDFYHARFNVLVCTTIIESGIDIPNANTIIMNRSDRFGLAQLHQLRGRVGRSHHQAYAYLFVNSKKNLTKDANKRLDAISMMEDLGAGFTLATHDLEIRGAGEILGEEQSGQIQAIGYNLYMDFLDSAVKALKSGNQPELLKPLVQDIEIDLGLPALLPDSYIYDVYTRLTFYKRIANNETDLDNIRGELIDRFGLLPESTKNLFSIAAVKNTARALDICKIKAGSDKGYIEFVANPNIDPKTIIDLIQKHPDQYKLEGAQKLTFTVPNDATVRIKHIKNILSSINPPPSPP